MAACMVLLFGGICSNDNRIHSNCGTLLVFSNHFSMTNVLAIPETLKVTAHIRLRQICAKKVQNPYLAVCEVWIK